MARNFHPLFDVTSVFVYLLVCLVTDFMPLTSPPIGYMCLIMKDELTKTETGYRVRHRTNKQNLGSKYNEQHSLRMIALGGTLHSESM